VARHTLRHLVYRRELHHAVDHSHRPGDHRARTVHPQPGAQPARPL